tara:strand:+ start:327 stop:1388 length:1062 start_codon:yes stop_codon:yes gene_type:complete
VKDIQIEGRKIGLGQKPFVVAEMSGNHNQSLERALAIVESAAQSGADAVKLQTYTADTMTLEADGKEFFIEDQNSLWAGKSLYKLYQKAYTPWEWHKPIMDRCRELGVICFSTPFDETALDFLEELDVPCYKIASFENTDIPLVKKTAATGKPVIISTGMATLEELQETVSAARDSGCKNLVLLKCTSAYPSPPSNANIITIPEMRERFECQVGVSDHTMGVGVAISAVALGAVVVEKHFTLARSDGGVDSAFSIEPEELKTLVAESTRAWQALGSVSYGPTEPEKKSLAFRRSLYVVKNMQAGEKISPENVRAIRPGNGLAPRELEGLMGIPVVRNVRRGTPLSWELIGEKK